MPPYPTRLLAELVGTSGVFFLGLSGSRGHRRGRGEAGFGLGLAPMIVALGHISGAHTSTPR